MPTIGRVRLQPDGSYRGQLKTLSMQQAIHFMRNRKTADNHPDFLVMANDIEIGAAWIRNAIATGNEYVSISLAAPEFGNKTLYANLGRAAGSDDDSDFAIIWNPQD